MKQTLHVSLWSIRDLRLVLAGRTLSFAGDAIALVALMLRLSSGGPGALSALLLAFAAPMVVAVPLAGRIVDRYDSRTVLVAASLLQAVAGVGIALADGLAPTLALVCVLQLGQAVAGPAWGALIPRIVGDELVGRATGTGQALTGLATLAGSAAGGLLVGWFGGRVALLTDAATFAALAVVAVAVRTRRRAVPGAAAGGGLLAGFRAMYDDRLLRVLVPGLWVFIVTAEAVNVVEVLLVTQDLGLTAQGYGLVLAVQGGGAIAGAWFAGRIDGHLGRTRAVVAATAVIGAGCLVMGTAGTVAQVVLGATVCGLAGGVLNAACAALVVTRTADAVRGRVLAALTGSCRAFSVCALLLGGLAGVGFGARGTFALAGGLCVAVAVLLALAVGRARAGASDPMPPVINDSAAAVPTH